MGAERIPDGLDDAGRFSYNPSVRDATFPTPDMCDERGNFYYSRTGNDFEDIGQQSLENKINYSRNPKELPRPPWYSRAISKFSNNLEECLGYTLTCLGIKTITGVLAGSYVSNTIVDNPKNGTDLLFRTGIYIAVGVLTITPLTVIEQSTLEWWKKRKKQSLPLQT